ncbi:MAG: hypothetical protein NT090_19390, partial [Acidobacteria bacterium]|nr:hypothetical protein [Acidobacteriota bacterium]
YGRLRRYRVLRHGDNCVSFFAPAEAEKSGVRSQESEVRSQESGLSAFPRFLNPSAMFAAMETAARRN